MLAKAACGCRNFSGTPVFLSSKMNPIVKILFSVNWSFKLSEPFTRETGT
jgi:hypothetical protein